MRKAVSKQVRMETDGETCAEGSAILAEAALSWRMREEVRGGGVGGGGVFRKYYQHPAMWHWQACVRPHR